MRSPIWSADPTRFELDARRAVERDPAVWRTFVSALLDQSSEPGRTRLSAKRAMEETRARLRRALDNSHTAILARTFIRTYPELGSYVETRGKVAA